VAVFRRTGGFLRAVHSLLLCHTEVRHIDFHFRKGAPTRLPRRSALYNGTLQVTGNGFHRHGFAPPPKDSYTPAPA
jgi:hypothetical protein